MPALAGARREARERALSLLYEAESKGAAPSAVLSELPVEPDRYVVEVVRGVERDLSQIDALLARHSIGWGVERMPAVDRALLRMATFELLDRLDVPTAVVISEAVELAKQYSTEESGRFVNGVLATVAGVVRGPAPAVEAGPA
ncbi:MAG: transcription antitermination factor NusB [Acidimicrobiales bacterium]